MAQKIKRGDTVKVIRGRDKNKIGKVKKVFKDTNRIIVEEVMVVKRHMKARSENVPSGIVEMESPISQSNVRLVCPNCGEETKVGFKFVENKKVRYCKKCNEVIE